MLVRDVADQLIDHHCLADAGPAEHADLATLGEGSKQVDGFDSRLVYLNIGRLLDKCGGLPMDW